MNIPNEVPSEIMSGTSFAFTHGSADFPAPTYNCKFEARGPHGDKLTIVGADQSDGSFLFEAGLGNTQNLNPGIYTWALFIDDGGDQRFCSAEGRLEVRTDISTLSKIDSRTGPERILDAIEAQLERIATTAQQTMKIEGQEIGRYSIDELLKLQKTYRAKVRVAGRRSRIRSGKSPFTSVHQVFKGR